MKTLFQKTALLLALLLLLSCLTACVGTPEGTAPPRADAPLSETEQSPAPPDEDGTDELSALPEDGGTDELSALPDEDGVYTARDEVALYLHSYGHLPSNFVTKSTARDAGWDGGSLEPYLPGKCIGGDRFGNREGLLPDAKGRVWYECDINTLGARSRGAERLVYSSDGLIYYTGDHYDSFELLYGDPAKD